MHCIYAIHSIMSLFFSVFSNIVRDFLINFMCFLYCMWCTVCLHQLLHLHAHWRCPLSHYTRLLPLPILYAWKRSTAATPLAVRKLGNALHISDVTAPRRHVPSKPHSGWDLTAHGCVPSWSGEQWGQARNSSAEHPGSDSSLPQLLPGYLMSQQDSYHTSEKWIPPWPDHSSWPCFWTVSSSPMCNIAFSHVSWYCFF